MKFLSRTVVLALIWAGLWGDLNLANLVAGAIVALAVLNVWTKWQKSTDAGSQTVHDAADSDAHVSFRIKPVRATVYLAVFVYLLVRSTLDLTVQTLSPRPKIRQAIVECQMRTDSALIATIVANSVSMTPGTLTIEISSRPCKLYVHTLRFTDRSDLQKTVSMLERLALRALASNEFVSGGAE